MAGSSRERFMKATAVGITALTLVFGLACSGGGGGGGGGVPPDSGLPDGTLYVWEEDRNGLTETGVHFDQPYVLVDEGLDNTFTINNYGLPEWSDGGQLWQALFAENGFILHVESGVHPEQETLARLSVAVHPRGINWGQDTLDFINADPEKNSYFVISIMNQLAGIGGYGGGGDNSVGGPQTVYRIYAGGTYERQVAEGMEEALDVLYAALVDQIAAATGLPALIIEAAFPREMLDQYMSGIVYESVYVGGTEVTLSELLNMYRDSANWASMDFMVEEREDGMRPGCLADVEAASGSNYRVRSLPGGGHGGGGGYGGRNSVYGDSSSIRYSTSGVPMEYWGLECVRPYLADAGWPETEILVTLTLDRDATVYVALDKRLTPPGWILADWTYTNTDIVTTDTLSSPMPVYSKHFAAGQVFLPGQGNAACRMYIPFAKADETFNYVLNIIATSHAVLMTDDPAQVTSSTPATRQEGGIVLNANGITYDGGSVETVVHVDFVEEFDANVFLESESADETALASLPPARFVSRHLLRNNGFRLLDTYTDDYPAFGAGDQVLQVENFLGNSLAGSPLQMVMRASAYQVFTNFNLLNNPNVCGIYLKSIATDDPALAGQLWKNDADDRGLNLAALQPAVAAATGFTFFYASPSSPVALRDILYQLGLSDEGELSFGVDVALASGYTLELRAGLFNQDYFTNVYGSVLPSGIPMGGMP